MRDKYWSMYSELIDAKYYYEHYKNHAACCDNLINGLLCIASFGGIGAWVIWEQFPWVWAIIVGTSQIISAINRLFPFAKQVTAVCLLAPELDLLINEVDHNWDSIERSKYNDSEISNLIYKFKKRYIELKNKYIKNIFHDNKRCLLKAERDRGLYFFQHYSIDEKIIFKGEAV